MSDIFLFSEAHGTLETFDNLSLVLESYRDKIQRICSDGLEV